MSPAAIQIKDEKPLGWSIYPAAQFVTEREREGERRRGGGELTL